MDSYSSSSSQSPQTSDRLCGTAECDDIPALEAVDDFDVTLYRFLESIGKTHYFPWLLNPTNDRPLSQTLLEIEREGWLNSFIATIESEFQLPHPPPPPSPPHRKRKFKWVSPDIRNAIQTPLPPDEVTTVGSISTSPEDTTCTWILKGRKKQHTLL